MRSIQAVGIIFLALAALWAVSGQLYMFEIGPGYKGPTIAQNIGEGVTLLLGGSSQGTTVGGVQVFLLGLIGSAGFVGIILLACGGIGCVFQSFLRNRLYRSQSPK